MKTLLGAKPLIPLALVMSLALATLHAVHAQPSTATSTAETMAPPQAASTALPVNIVPGTPLAEVVRLIQAGVDVPTIESFIANAQSPFDLDADKIMFLKDEGVPNEIINAMLARDKVLFAAYNPPQQPATTTAAPTAPPPDTTDIATAPPPEEVNTTYFYNTLTPYGAWLNIDGYGQCWRPTAVVYNSSWRPYCDHGCWNYTDCGWYWNSDYAWGATFHYGRWFNHARYGWCWYPDNVWAPSWVTWRSCTDYCGWAPLPPFAAFLPGAGFFYHGASVGAACDFGLAASCFVFVPPAHFCDQHPRNYCADQQHAPEIFHHSAVVNDFGAKGHTFVNHGIPVEHITSVTHRPLEPIHVSSLPNAVRQGWRGENFQKPPGRTTVGNNAVVGNNNSARSSATGNNQSGNNQSGNNQSGQNQQRFNRTTPNTGPNTVYYDSTHHIPVPANTTATGNGAPSTGPSGDHTIVTHRAETPPHSQPVDNTHPQSSTRFYQQPPGQQPQPPQPFQQQPQQQQQVQHQPQPQTRPYNIYVPPTAGVSQNAQSSGQTRTYNSPAGVSPPHGDAPLQQRAIVIQNQTVVETHQRPVTPAPHTVAPGQSQAGSQGQTGSQGQSQSHPSGNGGGGGSGNGGGNGNANGSSGNGSSGNGYNQGSARR